MNNSIIDIEYTEIKQAKTPKGWLFFFIRLIWIFNTSGRKKYLIWCASLVLSPVALSIDFLLIALYFVAINIIWPIIRNIGTDIRLLIGKIITNTIDLIFKSIFVISKIALFCITIYLIAYLIINYELYNYLIP